MWNAQVCTPCDRCVIEQHSPMNWIASYSRQFSFLSFQIELNVRLGVPGISCCPFMNNPQPTTVCPKKQSIVEAFQVDCMQFWKKGKNLRNIRFFFVLWAILWRDRHQNVATFFHRGFWRLFHLIPPFSFLWQRKALYNNMPDHGRWLLRTGQQRKVSSPLLPLPGSEGFLQIQMPL